MLFLLLIIVGPNVTFAPTTFTTEEECRATATVIAEKFAKSPTAYGSATISCIAAGARK